MNRINHIIWSIFIIGIFLTGCSSAPQKREFKLHNSELYVVWPAITQGETQKKVESSLDDRAIPKDLKKHPLKLDGLYIKHVTPARVIGSWRRQPLIIHGQNIIPNSTVELCWPKKCITLSDERVEIEDDTRLKISITTGIQEEQWQVTVIEPDGKRSNTLFFDVDTTDTQAASQKIESVVPAQPEVPRYRFVGEIHGESNYGIKQEERSFFAKLVGLMTGEAKPLTLQRPQSGYTDGVGTVYVTDISRQAVVVFNPKANGPLFWEYAGSGESRFQAPVAITPGPNNEFLVTDADLAVIVRLDQKGKPLGQFGKGKLTRPTGIVYSAQQGLIYVADTQDHNIKVFDESYSLVKTIGVRGEAPGQFNYPTHIHFRDHKLYVIDTMNSRVQIFDPDGNYLHSFGKRGINKGDLPRPKGITTDGDGNIYVIESYYDHLLIYNKEGQLLLPIGGTGKGTGQFFLPAGVWSDHLDRIYIADMFNGRVVILQFLGGE
ncbi:MAG TPA: hypothetical protein ENH92_05250 [Ectothiorhodospiraceae bacterium]|nr:hypothetical protein [Ectothiorhodospiraceae bacterium]